MVWRSSSRSTCHFPFRLIDHIRTVQGLISGLATAQLVFGAAQSGTDVLVATLNLKLLGAVIGQRLAA
jgi:hypothetical protein